MRCPICGKDALPRAENAAAPFCSTRCKQIDLGAWLNESYRVPTEEPDQDGQDGSAPGGERDPSNDDTRENKEDR